MKPRMTLGAAALSVVTMCVVSACSDPQPVRVGIIITGDGVAGAELAVSEINTSGGVRGRPLVIRVMSEGGSTLARPALTAADSLSQDPTVIGVVGHSNSSASISGAQIYNARHVVQIAPTSSAPLLSQAGPYTFRLVASDIHQAQFLAAQIMDGGAKPKTAVYFVNDDYGRSLDLELHRLLTENGVPLVLETPYTENEPLTDVDAVVRTEKNSGAELLVWLGRPQQLRQLLPALRRAVPRIQLLASDGVDNGETERNTDGALTGLRYVCFVDVNGDRPALVAMRSRFHARTGGAVTVETALTYDAVMLLAMAAREVGTRREAIRAYVASLGTTRPPFPGVTRDITFDVHGDPRPSYCLAEVTARGARMIRANASQ